MEYLLLQLDIDLRDSGAEQLRCVSIIGEMCQ